MFGDQNYNEGDEVIIHSIGDGKEYEGTICGLAIDNVIRHFIIKLKDPECFNPTYKFSCAAIPTTCLKRKPKAKINPNDDYERYRFL